MARTVLTPTALVNPQAEAGTAFTFTAADISNSNACVLTGQEILLAFNSDVSTHNVSVNATNDLEGRAQSTVNDPVGASALRVYQRFPVHGWIQSDGKLYFNANNALVKFAVLQMPT